MMLKHFIFLMTLLILVGCSSSSSPDQKKGLKVIASSLPHAQMLEFIQPDLKEQGIDLIIIVTDDYNKPNSALANGEVDANFFQHIPFMDEQIRQYHYSIESLGKIEIEPMGLYSKKIHSLTELKDNATIALPNDPSNEARALLLLQQHELIQLDEPYNLQATVLNIKLNPKNFKFIEVAAAVLPSILDDIDAAAITTNYALEAHLSPLTDALVLEDADSPYANVVAVRVGEENSPDIMALKRALTSQKMREFIMQKYRGAVIPAF